MQHALSVVPLQNGWAQGEVRRSYFGVDVHDSLAGFLAGYDGDEFVYVLYPGVMRRAARTFLDGLRAKTMYAVKANAHSAVIATLFDEGVRTFELASIKEIELVREHAPGAEMYLMHPVKSRRLIRHAYAAGIRHFALDCAEELNKILEETGHAEDLHLHIRLSLPKGGAAMPLLGKFGADFDTAIALLHRLDIVAAKKGLCFHVGSQCMDPQDYARAIEYVRQLVDASGVEIDSLDIGGGFPVAYPDMPIRPMQDYFDAIHQALDTHGFTTIEVMAEPGRSLCAEGGSTVTRVELRKGQDLYLNDGTYGSLFDAGMCAWKYPTRLVKQGAEIKTEEMAEFRFFGPTCDSLDTMNGPFALPNSVAEGDWIEVQHLGAYGQAIAGDFNGFSSNTVIAIL